MDLNPQQFGGVNSSPIPEVAAGAASYRQQHGFLAPEQDYSKALVTPSQTRSVGQNYMDMPSYDRSAEPAFHQMGEEVGRQFDHMTAPRSKGGMGIDVSVHPGDPYGANDANKVIPELRADVQGNSHIGVLDAASTGGHPIFSNDQNNMFRAVHDVFGHLGSGRGVDRHGEEGAFQAHSSMFSPLARQAMTTETRGQNQALHLNGGQFQEQKVGLLSPQFQQSQLGTSPGDDMQAVQRQAQQFHSNQWGR